MVIRFKRPQNSDIYIRVEMIESFEREGFYWGQPTTRIRLTNGKSYEVVGHCDDIAKQIDPSEAP